MRVALDSNIVLYAEDINDAARCKLALATIDLLRAAGTEIVLPVQVLGEVLAVLQRKSGRPRDQGRASLLGWLNVVETVPTTAAVMVRAADISVDHQLAVWDCVILAAASEAKCCLLLSEDMQDGFCWGGVTLINPFIPASQARLEQIIA